MTQQEKDALFLLLRYAMGIIDSIPEEEKENIKNSIPVLYEQSKSHDLAHMVAYALFENELISSDNPYFEKFKKRQIAALVRETRMSLDLTEIASAFEKAGIAFIPLKGSVLRGYYPEKWMRTSSDIDILVKKSDLQRALTLLIDEYGYTYMSKYIHDVSLSSRNGGHIEVHYSLIEESAANDSSAVIETVWDNVELKEGYSYWYEMKDEYFYLYHIAHAAKHFLSGGCGIKSFLDLWILVNKMSYDAKKRKALIQKANLSSYDKMSCELASVWFDGKEIDKEEIRLMQNFIITGGVYGTPLNHMAMQQQKRGGKLGYVKELFFPSFDYMSRRYPVLEKHKWMLPFVHIYRSVSAIFRGSMPRIMKMLKVNSETPKEIDEAMVYLLKKTGLN